MDFRLLEDYLAGDATAAYEVLGAHFSHEYEQEGVRFTVYAPNARQVALIGDFNGWEGYDMYRMPNGFWTIFAQSIPQGALYKFRVTTSEGQVFDRMDPFAFYSEVRPNTASVVWNMEGFAWTDERWMAPRDKNYNKPLSIYEVHTGSWRLRPDHSPADGTGDPGRYGYMELADQLIPYVKRLGYTHIELMPLTEHPFDGSWGYQNTGYYGATSRYGIPQGLMTLVNRCHEAGIGVILDFVPAHFVSDFYALHQYDGGFLYESERQELRFSEWGTVLFDYTKPHVLSFMKSALHFWLRYYHFDGIRYDAVSRLIYHEGNPDRGVNEAGIWFLKSANHTLQARFPGVMLIAEDSSDFIKVTAPVAYGGLGFDYKWDLGWMNDTLGYLSLTSSRRAAERERLTCSMDYFQQNIYLLPLSHDEVVHGKKSVLEKLPGSMEEKFSQLRCLYLYMFTHPGKKLNFMGNELAALREWDESAELDWALTQAPAHKTFLRYFAALQKFYLDSPPLYQEDYHSQRFDWAGRENPGQALFCYRRGGHLDESLYVAVNFSAKPAPACQILVARPGVYEEVFTTDAVPFGGKGHKNPPMPAKRQRAETSIDVALPPYGGVVIRLANVSEGDLF